MHGNLHDSSQSVTQTGLGDRRVKLGRKLGQAGGRIGDAQVNGLAQIFRENLNAADC